MNQRGGWALAFSCSGTERLHIMPALRMRRHVQEADHLPRAEIAGVKVATAKVFHEVVVRAMRLHGGLGLSLDRETEGKKTLASVGVAVAWWPWPWLRAEFSYGARLVDIDRPENTALQDHGIDFRLFATAW